MQRSLPLLVQHLICSHCACAYSCSRYGVDGKHVGAGAGAAGVASGSEQEGIAAGEAESKAAEGPGGGGLDDMGQVAKALPDDSKDAK